MLVGFPENSRIQLKILVHFLCRLRSIAAHRDRFVWHLSVDDDDDDDDAE